MSNQYLAKTKRNTLSASVTAIVIAAGGIPAHVTAAEGSAVLEEIVVTAQKREENLQDVGIAVTAFTGDQIREFGFTSAVDVVQQTPGLSVARPGAGAINAFSIRGVSQNDFASNQEGPVAVYIDEAYISQNVTTNFSLYDLERVEVLRGPQGTLFGRNATGGLVQYVTVKPSQEFDAFAEGEYGSDARRRIEAAVGGGLTDTISARLSGVVNQSDGLMDNRIGKDGQAANDWSVRGQLLFEPSDDLSILVKTEYLKDDSDRGDYFHRVGLDGAFEPAPATDFFGYRSADENNIWAGAWDFNGYNKSEVPHFTAKVDWKLGAVDLAYVGDYQDIDHRYGEDSDVSPNNVFNFTDTDKIKQWSQELRASWEAERSRFVVGAYFLHIDGDYGQDSLVFGQEDVDWADAFYGIPEPGGYNLVSDFHQETKTWAAFGQMDFDLTETLTLTTGARWTQDDKDYSFTQEWTNADGLYVFFEGAGPGTVPYFDFNDSFNHGDWSGKIELDYKPNDDWLWYGSINRGIKSGGFNAPVDATGLLAVNTDAQFIPFAQDDAAMNYDPEVLTSYEAGFKSTLFGGSARLNTAAFYYDYNDYQIYNLVGLTQIVFNSDGKMWGGEVELATSPLEGLDLMLGLSLLDTNVDLPDGIRPDGQTDSDSVLSPKWTINGLVRYEWQAFGDGRLAVQSDFFWKDHQIFNLSNTPVVEEGAITVVNASVTYTTGSDALYATLFAKNLFDETYRDYGFDTTGSFGSVEGVAALDRWYGITVGYRWH